MLSSESPCSCASRSSSSTSKLGLPQREHDRDVAGERIGSEEVAQQAVIVSNQIVEVRGLNSPNMCPAVQTNSLPSSSKGLLQTAHPVPFLAPSKTSPKIGSTSSVNPGTFPPPPYIHSHALPSALNPCLTTPSAFPALTGPNATRDLHTRSGISALCFENSTAVAPPPGLCASAQSRTLRGASIRSLVSGASTSASSSTSEAEESEAESMGKWD